MLQESEVQAYFEELNKNSGIILGLDSIRELMAELGDVQEELQIIHVAGTNGKGSVCTMISSILMEAGVRVGTYTSPAVFGRMEQYQVNGTKITEKEFAKILSQIESACMRMTAKGRCHPTAFEVETAAAFLYFYQKKCQIVVLETGMGGATDATNIIQKPLVSVLTSISMDHMKFLGDSLEEIAQVKAGIVKKGCPVVAALPKQPQVMQILKEACKQKQAELIFCDERRARGISYCASQGTLRFWYEGIGELGLCMMGAYQVQNAICAIETAKILRTLGISILDCEIRRGLEKAYWEGRFSILSQNPLVIMDGAHNADAAKKLCETLKRGFTNYKIIYIIGVLADKDHEEMLRIMLPLAWKVFTVTPIHPRAMDGQALAQEAEKYHDDVTYCPSLGQAVEQTLKNGLSKGAMALAFGSLSYLKELREILKEKLDYD